MYLKFFSPEILTNKLSVTNNDEADINTIFCV